MPQDRCWVDGHSCPYGWPGGQYVLRPSGFCWEGDADGSGCETFRQHVRARVIPQERQDEIVDHYFDAHALRLSELLTELANRYPIESPQRLAFQQLADDVGTGPLKTDEEILLASATPQGKAVK